MKLIKMIVAGIVGGILIFVWGFLSHMVLNIGGQSMRPLSPEAEAAILPVVREHVKEGGFYFFPGVAPEHMHKFDQASLDAQNAQAAKAREGASGIMVIAPIGEGGMNIMALVKELLADIAAALLGALIVFWGVAYSGLFRTVGMSIAMGLMSWCLLSTSMNIWYRFPREWVIAEGITEVAGFAIAGVAFYIVGLFFIKRTPRDKSKDPLDMPI